MSESFFWKDKDKGILKEDLFSKTAEEAAEKESKQYPKATYTQMRNFYDEVTRYKTELLPYKDDKSKWDKKLPYIKMLKAKFAYAKGRKFMSGESFKFWTGLVNEIKDIDDFFAFADFFESFMAFYKQYSK